MFRAGWLTRVPRKNKKINEVSHRKSRAFIYLLFFLIDTYTQ